MRLRSLAVLLAGSLTLALPVGCSKSADTSSAPATTASNAKPGGTVAKATDNKLVNAKGFKFDPDKVNVKEGTSIQFVNNDDAPHKPTAGTPAEPNPSLFSVSIESNGISGSTPGLAAGTYKYFCQIHPQMTGEITVS